MTEIINAFENFMRQHGQLYSEYYVGIATDPIDRLTTGHGVDASIPHIYWTQPMHSSVVREIEKYFLTKGACGGTGGGSENTCYLYTYKITSTTRE